VMSTPRTRSLVMAETESREKASVSRKVKQLPWGSGPQWEWIWEVLGRMRTNRVSLGLEDFLESLHMDYYFNRLLYKLQRQRFYPDTWPLPIINGVRDYYSVVAVITWILTSLETLSQLSK
jgi:hypothetical protein